MELRAALVTASVAALDAAGIDGVTVTGDARELVTPFVFVDLATTGARQAMRSWSCTVDLHAVVNPDFDAAGADLLGDLLGALLTGHAARVTSWTGTAFTDWPGSFGLPEYRLTLADETVNY